MKRPFVDSFIFIFFLCLISSVMARFFWLYAPPEANFAPLAAAMTGHFNGATMLTLDQILHTLSIRLFSFLFANHRFEIGPSYGLFITMMIVSMTTYFTYIRYGFSVAFTFICLTLGSHLVFLSSTQVYPEPTMLLLSLISIGSYLISLRDDSPKWTYLSGVFAALALFTHITGIATLLALVLLLVSQSKIQELKRLVVGCVTGSFVSVIAFVTLFGLNQLNHVFGATAVFIGSFGNTLTLNTLQSPWDIFFDRLNMPVFICVLVFAHLYFNTKARAFVIFGWSHFLITYLFVAITPSEPTFGSIVYYPCYFFFMIAVSLTLGEAIAFPNSRERLRIATVIACAWCLGFIAYRETNMASIFQSGFVPNLSSLQKYLLNGCLMLSIPLLIAYNYAPRRSLYILCMVNLAFWGGSYAVSQAHYIFHRVLLPKSEPYYQISPLLHQINAEDFDIYVPEWNSKIEANKLKLIYQSFLQNRRFRVISDQDQFRRSVKDSSLKQILLTSRPNEIEPQWYSKHPPMFIDYQGKTYAVFAR